MEYFNPGGSTKDRVALNMTLAADSGALKPGGMIIEATELQSSDTGVLLEAELGSMGDVEFVSLRNSRVFAEDCSI